MAPNKDQGGSSEGDRIAASRRLGERARREKRKVLEREEAT